MAKTFRYNPEEDWDTQMTTKQRKKLRRELKQLRRDRRDVFDDLEESTDSDV